MATYQYKVEGIYETDKGSGNKDYTNFNYEINLSRFYPEGAGSHIISRFLPTWIKKQKNKPMFSGLRHWVITEVNKIDDEFPLVGKEISELSEYEIQELACMYDILEIPLPGTMPIAELRKKAMLAYMKKVLKIPMKTPAEQEELDFFKRQPDGSLELDLSGYKLKVKLNKNFYTKKEEVKKKSIEDFDIDDVVQKDDTNHDKSANIVDLREETVKKNEQNKVQNNAQNGQFPSAQQLTNQLNQAN